MDYWWTALLAVTVSGEVLPVDGSAGVWWKSGTSVISSAMTMTGITVINPQFVYVYDRGKLNGSLLDSTGKGLVYSGGQAVGIIVTGSGSLTVLSGGVVSSASFSAAGNAFISAYGNAYNVSVLQGGQLNVSSAGYLSGGYASATANNGAPLYVRSGGSADNVTVDHFGYVIPYGGTITNVTVSSGGRIYTVYAGCGSSVSVLSGGQAFAASSGSYYKDIVVESGGTLVISTTASAYDVTLSRGAAFTLQSNCYVSGLSNLGVAFNVLSSSVLENLYASVTSYNNCTIQHTALVSGAYVESGDFRFAVSGRLESVYTGPGGQQNRVFSGGVVEDLINEGTPWSCNNGGSLGRATQLSGNIYIYSGAITTPAAIVISGGALRPENGGVVNRPTVESGTIRPYNHGVANGVILKSGAHLNLAANGSGVDCILSSGAGFYGISSGSAIDLVRKPWTGPYQNTHSSTLITYPTDGYDVNAMPPVTSGMICWFDALNNTGSGQDPNAATWVDRAGSEFDITLDLTKVRWINGGLATVSGSYNPPTPKDVFTEDGDFTIEVVGDTRPANTTRQCVAHFNGQQSIFFQYYLHSGYFSYNNASSRILTLDRRAGGVVDAVAAPCATIVVSGHTATGYIEGNFVSTADFTGNTRRPLNQPLYLFGPAGTGVADYIYSIRIYNRALTAEEIHQNWLFDRTRYFGARSLDTPIEGQYGVFIKSDTTIVSSAMEMFDDNLTAPYTQQIYNGGMAADGVISSGATQTVFSGGTAKRPEIASNGYLIVSSGGTAVAVEADSAATVTVVSGGVIEYASLPVDGKTGIWIKESGATISSAILMSGASATAGQSMFVYNLGIAEDCIISGVSARISAYSGAVVSSVTIDSAGSAVFLDGSVVNNPVISAGGWASLRTNCYNLTMYGGNCYQQTTADAVLSGASIFGGTLYFFIGSADDVTLGGGNVLVSSATVSSTDVASGYLQVRGEGVASVVNVSSGAHLYVSAGGSVNTVTLSSGGSMYVYSGGTALAVTSNDGAHVTSAAGAYIEYVTP